MTRTIIFFGLVLVARIGHADSMCDVDPGERHAVNALANMEENHKLTAAEKAENENWLTEISDKHPLSRYAEEALQDFVLRNDEAALPALTNKYAERADKAHNALSSYLYARILRTQNPTESIAQFQKALGYDPKFGPAHAGLASVYAALDKKDKAASEARASLSACPNNVDTYVNAADRLPASDRSSIARKLRALLDADNEQNDWASYLTLWNLEFPNTAMPTKSAAIKKIVSNDLVRMRLATAPSAKLLATMAEGAQIIGHKDLQRAMEDEALRDFPLSPLAQAAIKDRCTIAMPVPTQKSSLAEIRTYYNAMFDASTEWVKRWPRQVFPWQERLRAALHLPNVPTSEVESIASKVTMLGNPDDAAATMVEVDLNRSVHLQEVPTLAKRATETSVVILDRNLKDAPKSSAKDLARQKALLPVEETLANVEAYTKLKDIPQAETAFAALTDWQKTTPLAKSNEPKDKQVYHAKKLEVQVAKAQLLAAQGKTLDALALGQKILGNVADPEDREKLMRDMSTWWKTLGGSDADFASFTAAPAQMMAPASAPSAKK